MPQTAGKLPDVLRPYEFHGVTFDWEEGIEQVPAPCPWCSDERHFSVNSVTGKWGCWKCGSKGEGGVYGFLRRLWKTSDEQTQAVDYSAFARSRGLMGPDTLIRWGLVKSILTGDWLVPGYSIQDDRKILTQLYRYMEVNGKKQLWPTPGTWEGRKIGHRLLGLQLYDPKKETIFLCEGIWDAMVLWELLGQVKATDEGYTPTGNQTIALLGEASVLAVPGCNVFSELWLSLFKGKKVCLLYDNDHPRMDARGKALHPAGFVGMERAARMLSTVTDQVLYLRWGEDGYDPSLPNGHDVKDALNA